MSVSSATSANPPTPESDWENLRALAIGEKVRVVLKDAKTFEGELRGVTDTGLTIRRASGKQEFEREDILRVSHQQRGHRLRNTLIGLGVGAAAGLATGAAIDASFGCQPGDFICFRSYGKAVLTPLGGGLGMTVGVLLPTGRWKDVYRTEPR